MEINKQSSVNIPESPNTKVNIHSTAGEQVIKVLIENWLSYYGIAENEKADYLIGNIVVMLDTFGSVMSIGKKLGAPVTSVDSDLLAKITGQVVLAWSIRQGDNTALDILKNICLSIIQSPPFTEIEEIDTDRLVSKGITRVCEVLGSELYDDLDPPVIVSKLVEACICEVFVEQIKDYDEVQTFTIRKALEDRINKYKSLLGSYQRIRIIEDRVFHLLNADDYCTCIKRSLLTLNVKQLINLALCYYRNERIPDADILEALLDSGENKTTHGTPVTQVNIDRNIHYLLRYVLPKRLALEFSRVMQEATVDSQRGLPLYASFHPYVVEETNDNPSIALDKLEEMCSTNIGTSNKILLNDQIIEMCRRLERYIFQHQPE